MLIREKKTCK